MAFKKVISKEVEVGAKAIILNDDSKSAEIHYYEYEAGVAKTFIGTVEKTFEEMYVVNPLAFESCISAIQFMSDHFNPENEVIEPEVEVIDPIEE